MMNVEEITKVFHAPNKWLNICNVYLVLNRKTSKMTLISLHKMITKKILKSHTHTHTTSSIHEHLSLQFLIEKKKRVKP